MDNTIVAAIIGVVGGLIGAWIGGVLSRRASREATEASNKNAINIINRQEFNRTAAEFRDAFAEVQRLLAKHYTFEVAIDKEKPSVVEILRKFFDRHERAVIRFRYYVYGSTRNDFDAAWKTYCCYDDWSVPLECYSQKGGNDPNKEIQFMKLAAGHIENLLSYAQQKND